MSHTLTIEEAARRLAELISELHPGDEITLVSKDAPVAKIIPSVPATPRKGGACKGMLTENPDIDDDAHLADFKEYME